MRETKNRNQKQTTIQKQGYHTCAIGRGAAGGLELVCFGSDKQGQRTVPPDLAVGPVTAVAAEYLRRPNLATRSPV